MGRIVAALVCIVAAASLVQVAQAAVLKPVSLGAGCREGKKFANDFVNSTSIIDDWEPDRCYRRDRFRIVYEFLTYWNDGDTCMRRGVVTHSNGYYHWRAYRVWCDSGA